MLREFYAYHTDLESIFRLSEISGTENSLCTEISSYTFRELRSEVIGEGIEDLRIRIEENPFELVFDNIQSVKVMLELQS